MEIKWPTTINLLGRPEFCVPIHDSLEEMEMTLQQRQAAMKRYAIWDEITLDKEPVPSDYFTPNILVYEAPPYIMEKWKADRDIVRKRNDFKLTEAVRALKYQLAEMCKCCVDAVACSYEPDFIEADVIMVRATAPIYYYED